MAEWYVFYNKTENGPFADQAFLAFVKDKDPAAVHIWREGLDGWVLANTLPSLAAMMKPDAPALVSKTKLETPRSDNAKAKSEKRERRVATAGRQDSKDGVPWPTVSARDHFGTGGETPPSSPAVAVAVSIDDRIPDASDDEFANSAKWDWAQYGAIAGVVVGLIIIFYFKQGMIPAGGFVIGILYFLAYLCASALPLALIGFIAGTVHDQSRIWIETEPRAVAANEPQASPRNADRIAAE